MKLETKITYMAVNKKSVFAEAKSMAEIKRKAKLTPEGQPWHIIKRTETLSLVAEGRGDKGIEEIL